MNLIKSFSKKTVSFLALALLLFPLNLLAQNPPAAMADKFRSDGKIYIVILVIITIFIGIIIYLFSLERKIKRLEREQNK
ncbi:MAG: hypothetical protein BGO31_18950 [Bacteroidetes bacterium 43-16]|nr:MAG: hypothetical protein BGO31_18950 [Bacteroidetes bacterium 43-16]